MAREPRESAAVTQTWKPTFLGKLFTSTKNWLLSLDNDRFALVIADRKFAGSALLLENVSVTPGAIWSTVKVPGANDKILVLRGLPNPSAKALLSSISISIGVIRHRQKVAENLQGLSNSLPPVIDWVASVQRASLERFRTRGWLSHEFIESINATKPQGLLALLAVPEVLQHLAVQPKETQDAVAVWRRPFAEIASGLNQRHLTKELTDSKAFFDTIEKSALSEEQVRAVVCFDNRVLLVAAAGSGKTSTMVAKAGYALKKGYFAADRMLLLAFNNDAAAELRTRIKARLEPLGLPADKVVAKTFHAFGLDVIGAATGKKPSLAPWVESGRDIEALLEMVDRLKDADPAFRMNWDLFRLVFQEDLPKFGKEEEGSDSWDRVSQRGGFWTLHNEVVKSRGEQLIANWLFYNGVNYVYEAPYKHETADPTHRQYQPDFYLPDIDAYLEHWALDEKGEPPPDFSGYKDGMEWKKRVHVECGTKLLETTMAGLWSGRAFSYLETELTKMGIKLDPNPDRDAPGRKPIENPRLARMFRSFLTHTKSNRLTVAKLRKGVETGGAGQFRFRHAMFLAIFEKIWNAWESRLNADKCIDFEDMLNLAADCIESGRWESPYELVMVDEFQDASQARARLISGLVKKPDRYLFAVGDDWQSINRFAGADLSVMTDFEARFGPASILKLETTFRCPQALCDISTRFVEKNPKQLRKSVRSPRIDVLEPVRIIRVTDERKIRSAVDASLDELAKAQPEGHTAKVYVLGRYRKDEAYLPSRYDASRVKVEFLTVHSSKGLEADHIIIPGMTSETLGFPSRIADDSVLQLAMPSGDPLEYAEERRLFYVALTRARLTVTLVTVATKESPFITELVRDLGITVRNVDGSESSGEVCPSCGQGFLVERRGKYGLFMGCTSFPRCTHTRKVGASTQPGRSQRSGLLDSATQNSSRRQ
jgi:DNA helicase-4